MSQSFAGARVVPGENPSQSTLVRLTDLSRVGEARRRARMIGVEAGLDVAELANLEIVVSEIVSNAVRYGGGGELAIRADPGGGARGLEVLCLDRGAGVANVAECLRDGYSTGGSMGTGLGAAQRLSRAFDMLSVPGQGTAVLARLWSGEAPTRMHPSPEFGAVCLPVAGETVAGDGWAMHTSGMRTVVLVVDGLGHGPSAAEAATAAMRLFDAQARRTPVEILEALHAGLRATRGAAAAVAEIDTGSGRLRYAGLGNIAGRLLGEERPRDLVSQNGIVGHQARRVQAFDYPWTDDTTLVMHSDGIARHWKLDPYPGLGRRDPALIAGILYRDFARGRDDATVVACRHRRARPAAAIGSDPA